MRLVKLSRQHWRRGSESSALSWQRNWAVDVPNSAAGRKCLPNQPVWQARLHWRHRDGAVGARRGRLCGAAVQAGGASLMGSLRQPFHGTTASCTQPSQALPCSHGGDARGHAPLGGNGFALHQTYHVYGFYTSNSYEQSVLIVLAGADLHGDVWPGRRHLRSGRPEEHHPGVAGAAC